MLGRIRNALGITLATSFLYLPYIGSTTYRYDHFFTMIILMLFFLQLFLGYKTVIKELKTYLFFYVGFMLITVCYMFMRPGPIFTLVKVVNSFSYPLLAITLLMFYKTFIVSNYKAIIKGLMLISILFNIVAVMQYFQINKPFLLDLMGYYGGEEVDNDYAGYGSLAALTAFAARRSPSIFAHPMAFGMNNMIVVAFCFGIIKNYFFYHEKKFFGISLRFTVFILLINLIGGVFAMTKTYLFSIFLVLFLEGAHIFYLSKFKISVKQIILILIGFAGLIYYVKNYLYDSNRYFRNVLNMLFRLDFSKIFASRFSEKGYLEETGTLDAVFETGNFIFGLGREISKYAWADSGYIQALMVGGVFYTLIYYSFIFVLIYKLFKSKYFKALSFSLGLLICVLLVANSGVFVFIFPRVSMLLFIVVFFILGVVPYFMKNEESISNDFLTEK